MTWDNMTADEYAEFQSANGHYPIKIDDIWWMEVKPFLKDGQQVTGGWISSNYSGDACSIKSLQYIK